MPALWHVNCELGFSHTADTAILFPITRSFHFISC